MTIFEYFLVLLSVILSLGIAHLASGVGELLRARKLVTWSFTHILWLGITFALLMDVWASTWLMRGDVEWSIVRIVAGLLGALAVYLAAMWLIPRHIGQQPIDLYDYLAKERRLIFGALILYNAYGVMWNLFVLPAGQFDWANYYTAIPVLTSLAVAWIFPQKTLQFVAAIICAAAIAVYFSVYFPTIH